MSPKKLKVGPGDMVGLLPIEDKLRKNRLRWYRHVCHRPIDAVVRRSDMIIGSYDTRRRGRPKLTLDTLVENDMIGSDLTLVHIWPLDRAQWRKIIHVADFNSLGQKLGLVWYN